MVIHVILSFILVGISVFPFAMSFLGMGAANFGGIVRLVLFVLVIFIQTIIVSAIISGYRKSRSVSKRLFRFHFLAVTCLKLIAGILFCWAAFALILNRLPFFLTANSGPGEGGAPFLFLIIPLVLKAGFACAAFISGLRVWHDSSSDKTKSVTDSICKVVKRRKNRKTLTGWLARADSDKLKEIIALRILELIISGDIDIDTARNEYLHHSDEYVRKLLIRELARKKPGLLKKITAGENQSDTILEIAAVHGDWKSIQKLFDDGSLETSEKNVKMMISTLKNRLSEENVRNLLKDRAIPFTVKKHIVSKQKEDFLMVLFDEFEDLRMLLIQFIKNQKFMSEIACDEKTPSDLRLQASYKITANPALYELITHSPIKDVRIFAAKRIRERFFFEKIISNVTEAEVLEIIIDRISDTKLLGMFEDRGNKIPEGVLKKASKKKEKIIRELEHVETGLCYLCLRHIKLEPANKVTAVMLRRSVRSGFDPFDGALKFPTGLPLSSTGEAMGQSARDIYMDWKVRILDSGEDRYLCDTCRDYMNKYK